MDVVDALAQTFEHTRGVIAGVTPDQHGDKTPCTEWTVRELLEHMIDVVAGLGAAAGGQPPAPFELGDDPAAQFAAAGAVTLDAWRQPGVLDRVVDAGPGPMPGRVLASINLLDTATHTWDLATATGQPAELPEPVAVAAMEASRMIVTDELRAGRFAAEQPAPAGASATQELVAFLGRTATHRVGSRDEWLAARLDLLAKEKDLNRRRDELAAARRQLPWVSVDQEYAFDGPDGRRSLGELFDGRSQLLVYHFMYGPEWDEGCPSCSFWVDSFDGVVVHLAQRDVTLVCVSRAPHPKLAAYRERMGWRVPWYSSASSDFNVDYGVSFTPDQQANGGTYNFAHEDHPPDEAPGISAFARDDGRVFHTYSTYSRGLDPINSAYQLLDLAPKGRDEGDLEWPMAWLRRHDAY